MFVYEKYYFLVLNVMFLELSNGIVFSREMLKNCRKTHLVYSNFQQQQQQQEGEIQDHVTAAGFFLCCFLQKQTFYKVQPLQTDFL